MPQAYDVSLVLPVYNVQDYLAQALESLLVQTFSSIQIICVDDGSTDSSRSIIEEFQRKDARIQLICQENAGAAVARNKGLDAAQADYVMFLDPDDVFHPQLCEKLLSRAKETGADVCFCGAMDFVDNVEEAVSRLGSYTNVARRVFGTRSLATPQQLPKSVFQLTNPAPWNKIYRKNFLLEQGIRFQNLRNANDLYFFIAVFASAAGISSVEEDLVYYRNARTGGAQRGREKHPCEFAKALTAAYELLCEKGWIDHYAFSFCRLLVKHIRYNLKGPVSFGSFGRAYQAAQELVQRVFGEHPQRVELLGEPGRALVADLSTLDVVAYLRKKGDVYPAARESLEELQSTPLASYTLPIEEEKNTSMSKSFKISVVMPIYNVAPYLQDSVESVMGQTMGFAEHIQLIMVNDGSTDESESICRAYQQAHPENMILISQENAGVSSARNAGLQQAQGRYVTFLDPDDRWDLDAFQKAYDFLEEHGEEIDLVCCRSSFFEGKTGYHNLDAKFRKGDRVIDIQETPQHFVLSAATNFVKTDVAQAFRFDERLCYGEDSKYVTEIILQKGRYGVLASTEYHIRERAAADSLTQAYKLDRYTTTMEHYYAQLRAWADSEFACYRAYLEQCILNGVKYRITQDMHPDLADPDAYRDQVYDLVKRTDSYEFTRTPAVGSPRKLHLMSIKHGEEALATMEVRGGRVYSRGYDMGALPKNTLELRAVTLEKDRCMVEGVFRSLPHAEVGLALTANGRALPVNLTLDEDSSLTSLMGETVIRGLAFRVDIPLTDCQIEVAFALTFREQQTLLMPKVAKGAVPQDAKKWAVSLEEDGVLFLEKRALLGGLKGRPAPVAPVVSGIPGAPTTSTETPNMTLEQAAQLAAADLDCTLAQAKQKLADIKHKHELDFGKQAAKKAWLVPDARMKVFKKSVTAEVVAEDLGITPGEAFVKLDEVRKRYGLSHNRIAAKGLLNCASAEELEAAAQEVLASEYKFIDRICQATGLSAQQVEQQAEQARKEHGVSLQQYCNYGLYQMASEDVATWAEEQRQQRNATVAMVAQETGWSKRRVRKHMTACMVRYNVDATHYLSYRCWRLTDADLQGFATQTQSAQLGVLYNQDVQVLDSKVLFAQTYGPLMGRKTWVNRDTSFQEFQEFAQGLTAVFCKPESLSFGVGAQRVEVGPDLQALYEDLMSRQKMVVEEYVEQHPQLAEFAASCTNTLRFVNICKDGEYAELCCFLRLGRGDSAVDNYGAGGIAAAVDLQTGRVVTPGVDKFGDLHEVHPVSGKPIVGFQVPHWQAVKDLARRALEHVDGINYVGWDIAVRQDGPVLIEGNSHSDIRTYQACWAYQKRGTAYLYQPYVED